MNVRLFAAPWYNPEITSSAYEAFDIISDEIWRDASIRFYAVRDAKRSVGKSAPKGMQRYLNEVIAERFDKHNWIGDAGYFFKDKTWIRITFRHQMSLESDILDAVKVCKKENMELAVIMAANHETLKIVSPNDANALVSFEKLKAAVLALDGALDIPLIIGELSPRTSASDDVNSQLLKDRPRDTYIPTYTKE